MEKEKSIAKPISIFSKTPEMLVIKDRQDNSAYQTKQPIYSILTKFVGVKDPGALHLDPPLDSFPQRLFKRGIDIIFSTIAIVCVLTWMIPLLALLIKLDSKGPVFFLQKRNKRDGEIFTCIKFRTMVENEEADLLQATPGDERITKLGRFLRIHFLDELPQFFNVWIGDMSLIGPRPHMVSDNSKYEELLEYYDYRHKVKPGITGLSQVLGYVGETRNIQAMRDRVLLDIFYVRHWSFKLDLKIILNTFRKIL